MSAGEVERLVSELSGGTGGDEEEEWLYGDENEVERPEEENASLQLCYIYPSFD
uniref:Factor interacting with PAPOLA and CPSF1 n=1 Tax=Homo sapiens TaxID=9606 RepID=A0A994J3M5_HUMAN